MIILGIDPGTARLGYGLIEAKFKGRKYTLKLIETNVLATTPDTEQIKRLKILYKSLTELIVKHKPQIMVVERIFFNANAKTAMAVGQARGICMLAAAQKSLNFAEYTALEAKFMLTGYGRSDKKQMQQAVKDTLKLDSIIKSDDANDAVAMAMCYVYKELVKMADAGFKPE